VNAGRFPSFLARTELSGYSYTRALSVSRSEEHAPVDPLSRCESPLFPPADTQAAMVSQESAAMTVLPIPGRSLYPNSPALAQ